MAEDVGSNQLNIIGDSIIATFEESVSFELLFAEPHNPGD
jgi:hypothetical protein